MLNFKLMNHYVICF